MPFVECYKGSVMEYEVESLVPGGSSMVTAFVGEMIGVVTGDKETPEQAAKRMLDNICYLSGCLGWGGGCWLEAAGANKK